MIAELLPRIYHRRSQRIFPVEKLNDFYNVTGSIYLQVIHYRRFSRILQRQDETFESFRTGSDGDGQCPFDGQQRPVEAQLSQNHVFTQFFRSDSTCCSQDTDGQREVVRGTFLADIRRSHVDHNLAGRKFISVYLQGRNDPFVTFFHRRIGQSYEKKFYSTRTVDFYRYDSSINAL